MAKPGRWDSSGRPEHQHAPHEHHADLHARERGQVDPLGPQQPVHAEARGEYALERAGLGLFDEHAARARGREHDEHDRDAGGIERDHRTLAFLAQHGLLLIPNRHHRVGVGVREPEQARAADLQGRALQQSAHHLRRHRVARVVQHERFHAAAAEAHDGRVDAGGQDQPSRDLAFLHQLLGERTRDALAGDVLVRVTPGPHADHAQPRIRRECRDQRPAVVRVRLVGHRHRHAAGAGDAAALGPEDDREDREERDRHHERQHLRAAIAAELLPRVTDECADHSRSSFPVKARNAACSVAPRTSRSRTPSPAACSRASSGGSSPATSRISAVSTPPPFSARNPAGGVGGSVLERQPHATPGEPGLHDQLGQRARGDGTAVVHDDDALAARLGLFQVVRGEQQGGAGAAQAFQHVVDLLAALRVHTDGGLVQQHELRLVQHAAGEVQPALHAAGELLHHAGRALGEPGPLQRPRCTFVQFLPLEPVHAPERLQVLARIQQRVERVLLWNDAQFGARLAGCEHMPEQRHRAAVQAHAAGDGADQRGLAGAIRPQQSQHLALAERERHAVERARGAEALACIANL